MRRTSPLRCIALLYGSLFSGIGGIDLGFDRAGLTCAWQCEIDEYNRSILTKHWPDVPKHDDIRTFKPTAVDVVCGGFPCQDISNAGECEGINGQRSGLWAEYARIIREIRPRFVVVENVAALLVRGMGTVLSDLAACGYDAEWDCLPAAAFGARHVRDRLFIVGRAGSLHDANGVEPWCFRGQPEAVRRWRENIGIRRCIGWGPWATESGVDRTSYGVPRRVERKRGVGNAVVPDVAEFIGRRLMEFAV